MKRNSNRLLGCGHGRKSNKDWDCESDRSMSESVEHHHSRRRENDLDSECKYCECGRRLRRNDLNEERLEIFSRHLNHFNEGPFLMTILKIINRWGINAKINLKEY